MNLFSEIWEVIAIMCFCTGIKTNQNKRKIGGITMNRVEIFREDDLSELQDNINRWCKAHDIEPISVSITEINGLLTKDFVAAVVVKEL